MKKSHIILSILLVVFLSSWRTPRHYYNYDYDNYRLQQEIDNSFSIWNTTFITIFIIYAIIGTILSILVAKYAKKQGKDFTIYFIISFFFSPLIAFIILLIQSKSNTETRIQFSQPMPDIKETSSYDRLDKLGQLKDKGYITEEEFVSEKSKILNGNVSQNQPKTFIKQEERSNYTTIKTTDNQVVESIYISEKEQNEIGYIFNLIKKSQDTFFSSFNDELNVLIKSKCIDNESSISFLKKYKQQHKKDFIQDILKTTSYIDSLKEYLSPFINQKIIENERPFKYLKNIII